MDRMKLLGNRYDALSVPHCYPLAFSCEWEKPRLRHLYIRNTLQKGKNTPVTLATPPPEHKYFGP